MKRNIKLFEEFENMPYDRKEEKGAKMPVYLILYAEGEGGSSSGSYDGTVVGVAGTMKDAKKMKNDFKESIKYREIPSYYRGIEGVGEVWIKTIDPMDRDEVYYAFNGAAASPNGKEMVNRMIALGLDPTDYYNDDY